MLKISERWFERKAVSDEITLLWEPNVHPLLRCNIWHLRGRTHDLLIDTGLGVSSLKDEIANLVDRPLVAVATHIHYDHVGSLHEFEERLIHRLEADRMREYHEFSPIQVSDLPPDIQQEFYDPNFDELLINARPDSEFDVAKFYIKSATPTGIVDEGDFVDTGNHRFQVLHLPGHSPGSIGLWEKKTGILFSGDTILDGTLLDELPDSDIGDYVQSIKRLRELPVTIVHAGHDPSFGRDRLIQLCDQYLDRRR